MVFYICNKFIRTHHDLNPTKYYFFYKTRTLMLNI